MDDGDVYEGEWYQGRREGRGRMQFANGATQLGIWKEDTLLRTHLGKPRTYLHPNGWSVAANRWTPTGGRAQTTDVEQLRYEQYPRSATDSAVTESEYREHVRKGAAGELPYHRGREGEIYTDGCGHAPSGRFPDHAHPDHQSWHERRRLLFCESSFRTTR